ncbi:hypothetical protein ACFL0A_00625 [Patescibacteria group bacterium]
MKKREVWIIVMGLFAGALIGAAFYYTTRGDAVSAAAMGLFGTWLLALSHL